MDFSSHEAAAVSAGGTGLQSVVIVPFATQALGLESLRGEQEGAGAVVSSWEQGIQVRIC